MTTSATCAIDQAPRPRAVTVTYDYDAFGNEFTVPGGSNTPNEMMYRGEQYDSDLGLYYLRARYYNPLTGRFMSRDPKDPGLFDSNGITTDPKFLHKYLYANGDPVNASDPSGRGVGDYLISVAKEIWKVPTEAQLGISATVCLVTLADLYAHIIGTHGESTEQNGVELGLAAFSCGTAEISAIRYLSFLIP